MEDYHSELANYEPHERPLRSPRTLLAMRALVILAIAALILPGVITTYSFAESTAQQACGAWVDYQVSEQHRSVVKFELLGPGVLGWECYSVTATGTEHITSLGVLPGLNSEQAQRIGLRS